MKNNDMTPEVRRTAAGLVIFCFVAAAIFCMIVLVAMNCFSGWERIHTKIVLGFLAGASLAAFMAVHMALSLSRSVEMDEGSALSYTKKRYIIRTTVVFAVIILLFYTDYFDILSMLGGVLCLKPAAYIQGFFMEKEYNEEDSIQKEDISKVE